MQGQITILAHGFNKSRGDMLFLSCGLKARGIDNIAVKLPARFNTLNNCLDSLHLQIGNVVKKHKTVNFVGHSMGGLIIRSYINKHQLENVGRCVFIATPHLGSKLAGISARIPFYAKIFKPINDLLPSSENKYLLENKKIEIGIIAGNKNGTVFGKMFLSKNSDGRVETASALSDDAKETVVLPCAHKKIHRKKETLDKVASFILSGAF
ncbi:MAG: alpha/beta hydrolase [Spirochaetes bacterium]|nr:alpha/beta hydrolase [Spirochaetota bacterium]